MHFRLTHQITGYFVTPSESARFRVGGPHNLDVTFRNDPNDPLNPGKAVVLLLGHASFQPPPKAEQALRGIEAARRSDTQSMTVDSEEQRSPAFTEIPKSLQVFTDTIYGELTDAIRIVFELIRWRSAAPGPARPYGSRGIEWSDDGNMWHAMAFRVTARLTSFGSLHNSADKVAQIEDLISRGIQEPLAQTLLREAKEAWTARSYASALIMGLTALEVGVKHFIAEMIPSAGWLVSNSPSPPVVKIITDYIPQIPNRHTFNGVDIKPPKELTDTLAKAVTVRNKTVHVGERDVSRDLVNRTINAVSDMLSILDIYAGHSWAFQHISQERKTLLTAQQ